MRFGNIVVAYFVIGAVMWGGGAIAWDQAGVGELFIENPAESEVNEETSEDLTRLGGPINDVAGSLGASGLVAVWNVLVKLIGYLFWPITVLLSVDAPAEVVVLGGGTPVVAFFTSVLRMVRGS